MIPVTEGKPKRKGNYSQNHHKRTPNGEWNLNMIGVLLGTSGVVMGRYVNGMAYPETAMIKKLEVFLGWKAQDQLDLIPVSGKDLRYSMVLRQELEMWKDQNPRTTPAADLRSRFPSKHDDPFSWKAKGGKP
jgi:hypothetical protein